MKKLAVLAMAVIMGISMTGCAGKKVAQEPQTSSESESTTVDQKTDVETEAAYAENVELSVMHFFVEGDGRYELGKETLRKFKEAHTNINITEEAIAHDLYVTKVQTLGVTNDLPDVFLMKGAWTEDFVNAGTIQPLNDILDKDPAWRDNFTEGAMANHIYDGKIYSLPFTVDLNALMYYNEQMFTDNNIKVPETYGEFLTMCKQMNEAGIIPMALGNKDQWLVPTASLSCWVALKGGPDYMNQLCFADANYTEAPYVDTLKVLKELVDVKAFNSDFNSIDNYQMYAVVGNGEAASFIAGSWGVQTYLDTADPEVAAVTRVMVLPSFEDGVGQHGIVAGGSGWGWQINPNLEGAKREAAIELVKALTDENFAKDAVELASIVPAVADYTYDESKVTPLFAQVLEIAKSATLTPVFDQVLSTELSDIQNKTTQDVMAGGMTPDDAAAKVQEVKERLAAK